MPAPDKRRIVWLPAAVDSRSQQIDYIGERNPRAAIRIGDAIFAAVSRLSAFPESARRGRIEGTREMVVSGTPFVVVYRIEPDRRPHP